MQAMTDTWLRDKNPYQKLEYMHVDIWSTFVHFWHHKWLSSKLRVCSTSPWHLSTHRQIRRMIYCSVHRFRIIRIFFALKPGVNVLAMTINSMHIYWFNVMCIYNLPTSTGRCCSWPNVPVFFQAIFSFNQADSTWENLPPPLYAAL